MATPLTTSTLGPQRLTLQAEGLAVAVLGTVIYAQTDASWVLFAVLVLAPDLFMLGYLAGNRAGAFCYNLAHSYVLPVGLAGLGWAFDAPLAFATALVWGVHIGADRAIGYGLKYATGFKDTHLNRL